MPNWEDFKVMMAKEPPPLKLGRFCKVMMA
jgi:hypothetical protein